MKETGNYLLYMQAIAARLEAMRNQPDAEIVSSALDVPVFHFLPFKEITFFKLFAWTSSVYPVAVNVEEFAAQIESPQLLDCYKTIVEAHAQVPSVEIWTEGTIDHFLKLVSYHHAMGHFADRETPVRLCRDFIDLLQNVSNWAAAGRKGPHGAPYAMYLSEVEMENSFVLFKGGERASCILKLYTINSLTITDPKFCTETGVWLDHLARRGTLISSASERERYKFFDEAVDKVIALIDTIMAGGR